MNDSPPERYFTNPVLPGFHPDPSICEVDGRFYLVTSSFEYYPGIPLHVSNDLVSWEPLGHVLDRPSQLDLRGAAVSGGIFAPTIRHHEGVFYVVVTNVSTGGHFLVSAEDPTGDWSDPIWLDQDGIDPSLFFEGGKAYLTSTVEPDPGGPHELVPDFQRGLQQSVIDVRTGAVLEPTRFVWAGTGGRYPEAPHLFRRGDYYYLLIAEGGTQYGHMASIGRSNNPWGPFEPSPHGPVIDHRSISSPFQAMGHADFVMLPSGEWWAVCLGIRPTGGRLRHVLGRETFLAPVRWLDDEWPVVGSHGRVEARAERPPLPPARPRVIAVRDDFSAHELNGRWTFVRRPVPDLSFGEGEAGLTLRPAGAALDGEFPCFVGRRQQHHVFRAATRVSLEEAEEGDEAGLIVRMSDTYFYAVGVRLTAGSFELVLRERFGHVDLVTPLGSSASGQVDLRVDADEETYRFGVVDADGHESTAHPVDAAFMSSEVAGGFTGVFVGVYAVSEASSGFGATFAWFDYAPQGETGGPHPDSSASGG